jgi:hypothetical protein
MTQKGVKAVQNQILPDNTTIGGVLTDSGISINDSGTVAFKGRVNTFSGADAIMTQNGVVVKVGDTLGDGHKATFIFGAGTKGFNNAGLAGIIGRIDGNFDNAIFTQDGLLVTNGTVLGDGKTAFVLGGGSINNNGKFAFLGRVGAGNGPDAIMTQDGILAEVGKPLGDGRTLGILLTAPMINDSGDALFIGRADAAFGPNALMTQHGVLVESGQILPDGHMVFVADFTAGRQVFNNNGLAVFESRIDAANGPDAILTQFGLVIPVGGEIAPGITFNGFVGAPDGNRNLSVNDLGQIAFLATLKENGKFTSAVVLATPQAVPEPSSALTIVITCGLAAISLRRRKSDSAN